IPAALDLRPSRPPIPPSSSPGRLTASPTAPQSAAASSCPIHFARPAPRILPPQPPATPVAVRTNRHTSCLCFQSEFRLGNLNAASTMPLAPREFLHRSAPHEIAEHLFRAG